MPHLNESLLLLQITILWDGKISMWNLGYGQEKLVFSIVFALFLGLNTSVLAQDEVENTDSTATSNIDDERIVLL